MNMSREQRIAGQQKGANTKTQQRLERAQRAQVVDQVVDWSQRENLSISALNAALTMIHRASSALEDIEVATALDVERIANAAKTMHGLMRLELGESTSNVATAAVDPEILAARLAKVTDSRPTST